MERDPTLFAEVQTTFRGIHRWDAAPKEVDFLRRPHRHEFHVTVMVEQFHDDRDIEYIMFKRALNRWLDEYGPDIGEYKDLGENSCEMIATDIFDDFIADEVEDVDKREIEVHVLEDGENGAVVRYE